jgi:hypothetical protein
MATFVATSSQNYSASPLNAAGNGDTIDLHGYTIKQDIAAVPVSGTAILEDTVGTGQLWVPLNTLGDCAINVVSVSAAANASGLVNVTGNGTVHTLTINGNIVGGTGTGGIGLRFATNSTINVNGNVTGGSGGGEAAGILFSDVGNGHLNIVGNVTGGSGSNSYGVDNSNGVSGIVVTQTGTLKGGSGATGLRLGAGTYTLTGILDFTGVWTPYSSQTSYDLPPIWTPRAQDYVKMGTNYVGLPPAAVDVQSGANQFQSGGSLVSGTYQTTAATLATVVDASWVVVGHDSYTGGPHGSYQTTQTSYGQQFAIDQGSVTNAAAGIISGTAFYWINGQTGAHTTTYPGTFDLAADETTHYNSGLVDGAAARAAMENFPAQSLVIKTGTPFYGITGSLLDGTYTLPPRDHILETGTPYYGVTGSLLDGQYSSTVILTANIFSVGMENGTMTIARNENVIANYNGTPQDADNGTYVLIHLVRNDTGADVIAAGTHMTHQGSSGSGQYTAPWTETVFSIAGGYTRNVTITMGGFTNTYPDLVSSSPTPSTEPGSCTVSVTVLLGVVPVPAAALQFMVLVAPAGSGYANVGQWIGVTANGSGVASIVLPQGAACEVRMNGQPVPFTVPALSTYSLPNLVV